jgi:hypothetical protein
VVADEYEVLTDELAAHVGKVDALTERLRTAVDAANTVTMNNDAYGVVCQPFALLLQPFEELGVRTLRQAADAFVDTAKKVRDTTQDYASVDSAHAAALSSYEGEL